MGTASPAPIFARRRCRTQAFYRTMVIRAAAPGNGRIEARHNESVPDSSKLPAGVDKSTTSEPAPVAPAKVPVPPVIV